MRTETTRASQPESGITTISAIRYEVEIQPPSSIPAPIAPWMSASEALTIWIFKTAMKAPSVAPITASQVLAETDGIAGAVAGRGSEAVSLGGWGGVMAGASHDLLPGGAMSRV